MAALIDERIQHHWLPVIEIDDVTGAGQVRRDRWIEWLVVPVLVTILFICTILKTILNDPIGDIVAKRGWRAGTVICGNEIGVVAEVS